jgi:hypothetical protein
MFERICDRLVRYRIPAVSSLCVSVIFEFSNSTLSGDKVLFHSVLVPKRTIKMTLSLSVLCAGGEAFVLNVLAWLTL